MNLGKLREALPYYEKVMDNLTFQVICCLNYLSYLCIWKEVSLYISFDKIYLIKWCQLSRAFIWVLSWVSFYKNCVLSDITTLFTMKLGRWKHFCIGWVRICYGLCQINELHILPWLHDLELRAGLSVLHTKFCNIKLNLTECSC